MGNSPSEVLAGQALYATVEGDCVEQMNALPENSVDAIVCDPPYDLTAGKKGGSGAKSVNLDSPYGRARIGTGNGVGGFMGKKWDGTGVAFDPATWRAALRILKPGGFLLAFGGTRTYHRMACAVEDADFELRDTIDWVYGSGFPKSLNVPKELCKRGNGQAAEQWDGWGTALKPAHEPIIVARKELDGTVAVNILEHGVGALNIDGCRVPLNGETPPTGSAKSGNSLYGQVSNSSGLEGGNVTPSAGRWPTNLLLSHDDRCVAVGTYVAKGDARSGDVGDGKRPGGFANIGADSGDEEPNAEVYGDTERILYACVPGCPIRLLDNQSGTLKSGKVKKGGWVGEVEESVALGDKRAMIREETIVGDSGGASRFFVNFEPELDPLIYCAKAPMSERVSQLNCSAGCENDKKLIFGKAPKVCEPCGAKIEAIRHPTVKPLNLMRYLVRMVTPPGGVVLDCFAGSGTTIVAALEEGIRVIGIEKEPVYCGLIAERTRKFDKP